MSVKNVSFCFLISSAILFAGCANTAKTSSYDPINQKSAVMQKEQEKKELDNLLPNQLYSAKKSLILMFPKRAKRQSKEAALLNEVKPIKIKLDKD
jgi:hypothetical protein